MSPSYYESAALKQVSDKMDVIEFGLYMVPSWDGGEGCGYEDKVYRQPGDQRSAFVITVGHSSAIGGKMAIAVVTQRL